MIKMNENQVKIQFGTGDIGFNSGIYNSDGKNTGVIVFYNQEPREIGSEADIKAGKKINMNDFPIIMTFSKKESISALVESLLNMKKEF